MNNDKQIVESNNEIETETTPAEPTTLKLSREVVGVIAARTGIKAGTPPRTTRSVVGTCSY